MVKKSDDCFFRQVFAFYGAGEGIRTLGPHLGKVMLYP